MANLIAIVGGTGSGKSTSIRTLDPETSYIINVAKKPLPFRGFASMYNVDKKNYIETDNYTKIVEVINGVSEKRPTIKTLVIEDGQYIMGFEFLRRSLEAGFGKFSAIGNHMFSILDAAKNARPDLTVVYMSHDEEVMNGNTIDSRKMKTIGKMLDSSVSIEGLFTTCLYTYVDTDAKNIEDKYKFITNRVDTYNAKSPMGMFDALYIPNDLKYVIDTVIEYQTVPEEKKDSKK